MDRCPECGRDLKLPGGTVRGQRVVSRGRRIGGCLLLLLAAATYITPLATKGVNWYPYLPAWALVHIVETGGIPDAIGAYQELDARHTRGDLPDGPLIDAGLALHQRDLENKALQVYGKTLGRLIESGSATPAQLQRLANQIVRSTEFRVRSAVEPGAAIPFVLRTTRGTPIPGALTYRNGHPAASMDGKPFELLGMGGGSGMGGASFNDLPVRLNEPGQHQLRIQVQTFLFATVSESDPKNALASSEIVEHVFAIEVVDTVEVRPLQRSAALDALIAGACRVRQVRPAEKYVRVDLLVDDLPVGVAFDVYVGPSRHLLRVGTRWTATPGEMRLNIPGGKLQGPVAGNQPLDLLLFPSGRAAASTTSLTEVWPAALLFRNVPPGRLSRQQSESLVPEILDPAAAAEMVDDPNLDRTFLDPD